MKLKDIIEEYISGDWGNEDFSPETPCAVYCVRGADIVPISNDQFNDIPLRYVSKRTKDNKTLRAGDLVIEKSGGSPVQSTGRITYISQELIDSKQSVVCSNFCTSIRIKDSWNSKFIYYYWQYIYNSGVFFNFEGKTSGLKNLQFDNAISSIDIPEYTLEQQTEIADILSKLESKMTVNREINRNLEAMARQLYDYWFVQFDFPDENGRPYKSSGGKMVWNEKLKRKIPEGWYAALMKDFLVIGNGKDHKDLETGIYPVYGSGGLMRYVNDFLFSGESVLLPRKGSLSNFMYVNEPFWTVDTMFYTKEKLKGAAKYIYYSMRYVDITRYDSGTGVPSMTSISYYAMPFVKPTNDIVKLFDEILSPWIAQIKRNEVQIKNLTKQRDKLLPMLMNGQVSVMPSEVNCDLYLLQLSILLTFDHIVLHNIRTPQQEGESCRGRWMVLPLSRGGCRLHRRS